MGGPMQRMTPPRGMVPLGPQVGDGKEPTLTLLLFRRWQTQLKVCCCSPELRRWDETAAKRPGWPRDAWHEHVSSVFPPETCRAHDSDLLSAAKRQNSLFPLLKPPTGFGKCLKRT